MNESRLPLREGWYLWYYDRCEIVRGPYEHAETAGAVRTEIDRRVNKNLWVVNKETIEKWRAELAREALGA